MTSFPTSNRFVIFAVIVIMIGMSKHLAAKLQPRAGEVRFRLSNPPTAEEQALSFRRAQQVLEEQKGGEHYKRLRMHVDFPGIDQPELKSVDGVNVADSSPVVGIEVDGQAYAFVLEGMIIPEAHIANLTIGETPISVTYCDLVDSVRVFTCEQNSLIPLHVGGVDIERELVLLLDGERYSQSSAAIPLADYPFERTTFSEWRSRHPGSMVYIAPKREN